MSFIIGLLLLPGLVVGLTFHEAAHALSAKWLGDSTAERMGRVSLNPLRHLSPLGTLAIFVIGFGWGKPVMVNLYNFERPKLYYLLSSLAGPAVNLLLAGLSLGVLYLRPWFLIYWFFWSLFMINAILAVVNLLPIPPLDGSKIWPCLIPGMRPVISGKWSLIWLAVLILAVWTKSIALILEPVIGFLSSLVPST